MLDQLYAIFDDKSQSYGIPFASLNDDVALRVTSVTMSRNEILMRYSDDYKLYRLGTFDSDSGHVSGHEPLFVCSLATIIQSDPELVFNTKRGEEI